MSSSAKDQWEALARSRPGGEPGVTARVGLAERSARRLVSLFPWAVWAGTVTVAGALVFRYARRFPYSDDWNLVPVITGRRAMTLGWLWSQSAEHRLFAPRLVLTVVDGLADGDFRVAVWLNLVLLAALAAVAILTMRRVRGHSTIGDAFFPVVLLAPQLPGLNWDFHFHFVSTSVAAIAVLLVMTRYGLDAPPRWLWVSAASMLVLLGEGGPGLALLPGLGLWLVLSGMRLRVTNRLQGTLVVAAVGVLGAGMALYFVGWERSPYDRPTPWEAILVSVHAATSSGGDSMSNVWPLSGVAVALGLVATAVLLAVHLRSRSARAEDHGSPVALACFGVAVAMLVGAIGFGRGSLGWEKGLEHHYSDVVLPLACWAYVVWDRFTGSWRARVGVLFLALALMSYVVNSGRVVNAGREQKREEAAFRRDLCRGVAAGVLADRYRHLLFFGADSGQTASTANITAGIRELRSREMGAFDCP